MPRERTSADPHGRTRGDAELQGGAVRLLGARGRWRADTKAAYRAYVGSAAAKALRAEDAWQARRLFDLLDRLDALMDDDTADLMDIGRLARMTTELARALGIGPSARLSLGIKTEASPGSKLDAFRRG